MVIATSKKAAMLFIRHGETVDRPHKVPRWSMLTPEQKDFWQNSARNIVYPDLRLGYEYHSEMLVTLAVALYESVCYYKQGGGAQQDFPIGVSSAKSSILDEISANWETYNG
jgi:hypothetical protein